MSRHRIRQLRNSLEEVIENKSDDGTLLIFDGNQFFFEDMDWLRVDLSIGISFSMFRPALVIFDPGIRRSILKSGDEQAILYAKIMKRGAVDLRTLTARPFLLFDKDSVDYAAEGTFIAFEEHSKEYDGMNRYEGMCHFYEGMDRSPPRIIQECCDQSSIRRL